MTERRGIQILVGNIKREAQQLVFKSEQDIIDTITSCKASLDELQVEAIQLFKEAEKDV